jgi:hypothetical protein
MAATIEVSCPECGKEIKVSAELEGKKIRCKACEEVFTVKPARAAKAAKSAKPAKPDPKAKAKPDPKAAKKPDPKTAVKAKAPPKPGADPDDLDDDGNPYGVTDLDMTPRCPHCAGEMEEDAIICLECGYNTMTRQRTETKKVFERTGRDWFLWLFPGVLSVISLILLIVFDIWYLTRFDAMFPDPDDWIRWTLGYGGVKLWVVIGTLFGMFWSIVFIIRRLVLAPVPPEREKEDQRTILGIVLSVGLGLLMLVMGIGLAILAIILIWPGLLVWVAIPTFWTGYIVLQAAFSYYN